MFVLEEENHGKQMRLLFSERSVFKLGDYKKHSYIEKIPSFYLDFYGSD